LIEASEPGMTVAECCNNPPTCLIGEALWQKYRGRNPNGLLVPPDGLGVADAALVPYLNHIDTCDDCKEV
jgi:hypothetical protein